MTRHDGPTPRRSDRLRRLLLTPRERREVEARFTRDMQELRRRDGHVVQFRIAGGAVNVAV